LFISIGATFICLGAASFKHQPKATHIATNASSFRSDFISGFSFAIVKLPFSLLD